MIGHDDQFDLEPVRDDPSKKIRNAGLIIITGFLLWCLAVFGKAYLIGVLP
jgi:hypothetical protein